MMLKKEINCVCVCTCAGTRECTYLCVLRSLEAKLHLSKEKEPGSGVLGETADSRTGIGKNKIDLKHLIVAEHKKMPEE